MADHGTFNNEDAHANQHTYKKNSVPVLGAIRDVILGMSFAPADV